VLQEEVDNMNVVIVGGGTAGWLTALMMSAYKPNNTYTVIESTEIGIVGVGEGSTGLIRAVITNPLLGLSDYEFIKHTNATPKLGIRFKNWKGDGTHFDAALEGSYTCRSSEGLDSSIFSCVLNDLPIEYAAKSSHLTLNNKTNFFGEGDGVSTHEDLHAYHFNAHKVGKYFMSKCIGRENVTHIDSKITDVIVSNNKITELILQDGTKISADLFVDCSGFARLLSSKLNQNIKSFKEYLPLDSAFMFNLVDDDAEKLPVTMANAVNNGWIFEIPTQDRIGRGYIYCSQFADEDDIVKELETLYSKEIQKVKSIKFHSSRLEESFYSNCVSFGLSSCFFEPLQATNIHTTIIQVTDFINNVMCSDIESTTNLSSQKLYNDRINFMFDDIADFISIHYEGGREDTEFWKFVKYNKNKTEYVKHILEIADKRLTRFNDFKQYPWSPSQALYNITLAGIGKFKKEIITKQYQDWDISDQDVMLELNSIRSDWEGQSSTYYSVDKFITKINKI
jgi:tryptophan halogenase